MKMPHGPFGLFISLILSTFLDECTSITPFQLLPLRTSSDSDENRLVNQEPSIRLPQFVSPLNYDLRIRPILNLPLEDPQQFTAPGDVSILLTCLTETDKITLHSQNIQILEENVVLKTFPEGIEIPIVGHDVNTSASTYTIQLGERLSPTQNYSLAIPFVSLVSNSLAGLYRSSYKDETGNTKWLATTQFQKFGARQAFPCFDEPALKASFNTTIGRAAEFHSLTNSPLSASVEDPEMPGWFWDTFEITVPMSPYLVAIIVSDFVDVEAPQELSSYVVKTWGPPTITSDATGEYSAQAAAKILTYFETYFESEYQFTKLDSVAIPDFAAGAMENWAINTYRINLMLWFAGESTQFEQWRQSAVIAHEISHHWFGDLVTCEWWNDAWLNEGFARYMQFRGSNATGSDFGQFDRYVLDTLQPALEFDVTSASIPVWSNNTATDTPHPARTIYEKGASLIRMMQAFLTEETLIAGLRTYLQTHAYSVAVQGDLFAALQSQAETDGTQAQFTVKQIMDTWTVKVGFPLVRVSYGGSTSVLFSQEAFQLENEKADQKQNPQATWYIPINFATKSDPDFISNLRPKFWLDELTLVQSYQVANTSVDWLIVNPDARNYYRVLYDSHYFSLLTAQLDEDPSVFSLSTRSQLFDDYFQSSSARYVNIQSALSLTTYLAAENENTVWTTVLNNLRPIYRFLLDHDASQLLKEYLSPKFEAVLDRLGWEQQPDDKPVTIFLRSQLLDWSCAFDSTKCSDLSVQYIAAWAADPTLNKIPADIQPMVFCKAISVADSLTPIDVRNLVLQEYLKSSRTERYQLFINALACEKNNTNVESLMRMAIETSSEIDKRAHGTLLLQKLAENPNYRIRVVDFLETEALEAKQELGESVFQNVVSTIASYTSSAEVIDRIDGFIENLRSSGIVSDSTLRALESSRTKLSENVAWIAVFYDDINSWLQNILRT